MAFEFFRSWFTGSPPTTFPQPWRNISWGSNERDLQFVRNYEPQNVELRQLRIMVCGPVGSGKSSFINSVETVLKGRLAGQAFEDSYSGKIFTEQYRTYKIQKGRPDNFFPFALSDTTGFENGANRGVNVEDIKLAMKGHIQEDYRFNRGSVISEADPSYNTAPDLNDRVHVLVFVIAANAVTLLSDECREKMRSVRLEARNMGIPQLAILTKIDEACPKVEKNIRNVYKSVYLKRKMEELSSLVSFPMHHIFPVKNYHSEIDTNDDIDSLILSVMKHVINQGEDFVNRL